ncbi:hypothetical protein L218DRAFT_952157 [Marasmius fiardii PR-910]|nr:hypothetical protein L218DRAFT_952157 [Marasmius fiardii PR-910]
MVLSLNEFSAWITIEGRGNVDEYKVEQTSKGASCWIPSEAGQQYQVCWRDSERSTATDGLVVIDGNKRGTTVIHHDKDKPNTAYKRGFRTTSNTVLPFKFSTIARTDDADKADLSNSPFVGVIELLIYRVRIVGTESQRHYATPRERTLYERDVKGLQHHTTFGDPQKGTSRDAIRLQPLSKDPVARFRFRYRSIDMLRADKIAAPLGTNVSDPIVIPDDDSDEEDIKPSPFVKKEKRNFVKGIAQEPAASKDVIIISDDESKEDAKPIRSNIPTRLASRKRECTLHASPKQEPMPTQTLSSTKHPQKFRLTPSAKLKKTSTNKREPGRPGSSESIRIDMEETIRPSKTSSISKTQTTPSEKRTGFAEMVKPPPPTTKHRRDPRRTPAPSKATRKDEVRTLPSCLTDELVYPKEEVLTPRPRVKSEETMQRPPRFKEESVTSPSLARQLPKAKRETDSKRIVNNIRDRPKPGSASSFLDTVGLDEVKSEETLGTKHIPAKRKVEEESEEDISPSERAILQARLNALRPWHELKPTQEHISEPKRRRQKRLKSDIPNSRQ